MISQEIETDRTNHGTEFDKAFKEAMKKEVENDMVNRKRKQKGIEVYSDLSRNRWNEQRGYSSEEENTMARKNVGCN